MQHAARLGHAADAAGDAERDVEQASEAFDPGEVDRASRGACGDVVEHEFVGAFTRVQRGQLDDVAGIDVVAEAHALDHAAIAYVQAGNDAAAQHGGRPKPASRPTVAGAPATNASASSTRPSSSALPSTIPAQPARRAAATSAASRAPPLACTCRPGAHARSDS